jgi:beta-glucanase (GH16 family)
MSLFLSRPSSRRLLLVALLAAAACSPDGLTGPDGGPALTELAALTCTDYDIPSLDSRYNSWTPAFTENFASDLSQWSQWSGGAWNEELQLYQPDNLEISSAGQLTITARKESEPVLGDTNPYDATQKSFDYTSGRIESSAQFSASRSTPKVRMAARVRFSNDAGMWPAFWSYGDPWPTQGEIDILEARGQEPDRYQTAYWYGRRRGVNQVNWETSVSFIRPNISLTSCWHVYEVVWERNQLTFYLDGGEVAKNSGDYVPNMYGKKQRVTLNLAVGGLFFSGYDPFISNQGTLEVDWVRVHTGR